MRTFESDATRTAAASLGSPDVLGALASSPALFGRDDDPKAAIEAAVRGVTGTLAGPVGRASSQARGRTRLANFEMFRHLSVCGCGEDYQGSFSEKSPARESEC